MPANNNDHHAAQQGQRLGVNGKPVGPGNPPRAACFQKGKSGNPKVGPNAGASLIEFWNLLQDRTLDEIVKVADDAKTPAAKRAAAKIWVDAMSGDAGERMAALKQIAEFCNGRAAQQLNVAVTEPAPKITEADEVAAALKLCVPMHAWPPTLLARFLNGRIQLAPELVAELEAKPCKCWPAIRDRRAAEMKGRK